MEEQAERERIGEEIEKLFMEADADKNGSIDYDEFATTIGDWKVQATLTRMGLHVGTETAAGLFMLLDLEGQGMIKISDFAYVIPQIHGHAKSIDVAKLKFDIRNIGKRMNDLCQLCERNFKIMY